MSTIKTPQLMATLESHALAPPDVLAELRGRLAKARGNVDPRSVTKWLVQHKFLTVEQALDLLAGKVPVTKPAGADSRKKAGPSDDDLLLADDLEVLEDDPQLIDDDLQVVDDDLEVVDDDLQVVDDDLEVVDDDLEVIDQPKPTKPSAKNPAPAAGTAKPGSKQPAAGKTASSNPAGGAPSAGTKKSSAASKSSAPLTDLLSDPLLSATGAGGNPLMAQVGPAGKPLKPRKAATGSVWDNPQLLIGGGLLLACLILAPVLYWAIGRQSGDEAFAQAETDYKSGSYTQAIHKFDQYLQAFPSHKGVSSAKVQRGLAQIRQATDGASDFSKPLETSKKVIEEITHEEEFPQARAELAALLPTIAEGLAKQARNKPEQKLVDLTDEALAMVEKYVAKSMRPGEVLQAVEQSLALTRLELARGASLDKALADIKAAVASGQSANAYAVRKQLLRNYPGLETDRSLQDAVEAVSQSEKSAVAMVSERRAAETAEAQSPLKSSTALVSRSPGNVAGVPGRMVFALAEGAAYGLEATTGKVAWRRFVGFDTQFVPRLITRSAGADALMIDSVGKQLVCVDAATGKLRWRQPLAASIDADVLVQRNKLVVALRDGRLMLIDAESGDVTGYIKLPHRLSVAPAADSRDRHYYQLADHSNLYVLSAMDGHCEQVLYLGHEPSSIRVAPLAIGRYLLVTENTGAKDSTLRVLLTDEEGVAVKQVQTVALEGHVTVPMQVTSSKTLLAVTDLGRFYAFDIGGPEKKEPLTKVAAKTGGEDQPLLRYILARGSEFWVAAQQLNKFKIQAAQGRLAPDYLLHAGDTFIQPLEAAGDCLIHVRRRRGLPGVAVAAANMSDGKLVWETHLAAPLAGGPIVDSQQSSIVAMNLVGGLLKLSAGDVSLPAVENPPDAREEPTDPIGTDAAAVQTTGGSAVFSLGSGSRRLSAFDPSETRIRLRSLALPSPLTGTPLAMDKYVLVATRAGQVLLLDPTTGKVAAEPFQPRLESGVQIAWRPAALTANRQAVLADDRGGLYLLGLKDSPRPHLAALAQKELTETIASPVAVAGAVAYGANAGGQLMSFQIPDLAPGNDWNLQAPVVWGPVAVEDLVLVATANGQLHGFAGQERRWQVALPHGVPVGLPLASKGELTLACNRGIVVSLNTADGTESSHVDLGQPLASGPIAWGDGLLVAGHDGTLHQIARP